MNYKMTDLNDRYFIIGSIECEVVGQLKNCRCGFSWNNEKEAIERRESNSCIVMVGRDVNEKEHNILHAAWVIVGKDNYKKSFELPEEIESLDIQFNCVVEELTK